MAERRATWHKRCPLCKINKELCFCDHVYPLQCKTQLDVIIHRKERYLPSNTVNLLERNFADLNIIVRGEPDPDKREQINILDDHHPLFLYPSEDAIELDENLLSTIKKPIQLIIPDGTWRQAKKFKRRDPLLENIACVKLVGKYQSRYTLRKQKYENGLCTYEAAAYALGIIESKELQEKMLEQFMVMNERFQSTRPF
jgi:DTW domain-containing protein YfiP